MSQALVIFNLLLPLGLTILALLFAAKRAAERAELEASPPSKRNVRKGKRNVRKAHG